MKRPLGTILFVVYSIIAITVTVLLLSYNDYNCSEIGGYTVYIVKDDSLEPEYKQGSILLIKHTSDKNLQEGDEMFMYKVLSSQEYEVITAKLDKKIQQGRHLVYSTTEEENYASDYFIGKADDTVVISGWGYLLSLLESKWGYLFCIVIVSLLLFLQEAFELAMELKYGGGTKGNKTAKTTSKASTTTAKKSTTTKTATKTTTTRKAAPKKVAELKEVESEVVEEDNAENQKDVKEE